MQQDIELFIYRRMDGEIELFFRLSEKWVKNNDNPKNTVYVASTYVDLLILMQCIQFSYRDERARQVAIQSRTLAFGDGGAGWGFSAPRFVADSENLESR